MIPVGLMYVRARDKCGDPDFKETYLRDIIYKNDEISALFKEETIHVLDYDCEYERGYPDADKFPEFNNKFWRFFNTDTSMTTGHFKMADVESGAVMNLTVLILIISSSKLCQCMVNSDTKLVNHSISMISGVI